MIYYENEREDKRMICHRGIPYYNWREAIDIINKCEELMTTIIGIDFFQFLPPSKITQVSGTNYSQLTVGRRGFIQETIDVSRSLIKDGLPDAATYASFVLHPTASDGIPTLDQ